MESAIKKVNVRDPHFTATTHRSNPERSRIPSSCPSSFRIILDSLRLVDGYWFERDVYCPIGANLDRLGSHQHATQYGQTASARVELSVG